MPLDALSRVETLSARYADLPAAEMLAGALSDPAMGATALVSSFGADSAVLLHMVSTVAPDTPVLFIDTLMLFPETLDYQRDLAERLGLRDLRVIGPDRVALFEHDADAVLHRSDPDACCDLRKTRPLEAGLAGFDCWITGRKRFQGGARTALAPFEAEVETGRVRLNPLAGWSARDVAGYMDRHDLPRHPLVSGGFPSIGCMPCTSRVEPGEDPRAGRWRGRDKAECGIHFIGGRVVRGPVPRNRQEDAA